MMVGVEIFFLTIIQKALQRDQFHLLVSPDLLPHILSDPAVIKIRSKYRKLLWLSSASRRYHADIDRQSRLLGEASQDTCIKRYPRCIVVILSLHLDISTIIIKVGTISVLPAKGCIYSDSNPDRRSLDERLVLHALLHLLLIRGI